MNAAWADVKHQTRRTQALEGKVVNPETSTPAPTVTILHVHVAARDVIKLDIGSPSDPMCVLFIFQDNEWMEWGRTEIIWNDPNPAWVTFFDIAYVFEMEQRFRFIVYDCDSEQADLSQHDVIGQVDADVHTIVANRGNEVVREIRHSEIPGNRGTLLINVEQAVVSGSFVFGCLSTNGLKKLHTFSKNSPYIQVEKPSGTGRALPVYRSEVIQKAYGGMWKPFEVQIAAFCNADNDLPLTVSVYDYSAKHAPTLIGSVTNSFSGFMSTVTKSLPLKSPTGESKAIGSIKFIELSVLHKPTFYDYLRGGLELNLITAIDFTGSNGPPTDPYSLHYLYGDTPNPYEHCILAVGSVICPYDVDQLFPVYGFGAQVGDEVSHCFPLTFDPENPSVRGLDGILQVYKHALVQIALSGPTLFAPVINAATQEAIESFNGGQTYTILLILTDGCVADQRETAEAIVAASDAPLSIIIIGIGSADFSSMVYLDGDEEPIRTAKGEKCKRDIVQFVPFSKYQHQPGQLAIEVLAEVPRQVYEFCSQKRIQPRS
jgi:hypothetical protein